MEELSPEAFVVRAKRTDVFAETEPEQKVRIVSALQRAGLVVAYLGDGINDVAAIHTADTGISASNAMDVAKEAADFVLLEKDLSVLADGILEGRKSFINSMKYIFISSIWRIRSAAETLFPVLGWRTRSPKVYRPSSIL